MRIKGQASVELGLFLIILVIAFISIAMFSMERFNVVSSFKENEALRLDAVNMAGVLSFMTEDSDAKYQYEIETTNCAVKISQNSIIVETSKRSGIAYIMDTKVNIQSATIKCYTDRPTKILFTKTKNSIRATRVI